VGQPQFLDIALPGTVSSRMAVATFDHGRGRVGELQNASAILFGLQPRGRIGSKLRIGFN